MAPKLQFLLNGERRTLDNPLPTQTVLDYLRLAEGKCGTKEGCAEGDCGACTVVLGEHKNGRITYRAVNSCILFLSELDGRMLLTAEGLADKDGTPHPVQKSLVEHHASQCGYCTPGFVMALFALHHADAAPDRDTILEALAGNLCRCTGYRPIIAAAQEVAGRRADHFADAEPTLRNDLQSIARKDALHLNAMGSHYYAPVKLEDALQLYKEKPSAHLLAGGTDLGLLVSKHFRDLDAVISLNRIPELHEISNQPGELRLGAAVTYAEALPAIEKYWPSFGQLIRRIGSVQIRNLGTLGGNIANASPIGDTLPALLALNAKLRLASAEGTRELCLDDFFLSYRKTALRPGEIIRDIVIQKPNKDQIFRTYKIGKRFDQDISTVCAAFSLQREGEKITAFRAAFGGMAATPKRAINFERALIGKSWTETNIESALEVLTSDFTPLSDFRGSAAYRQKAAANLVRRFAMQVMQPEIPTEVFAL